MAQTNPPVAAVTLLSPGTRPPGEFTALDPRVIRLWRIAGAINAGVFLLLLLGPLLGAGYAWLWGIGEGFLLWLALVVMCAAWVWWFPRLRHQAWGYRMDARVLETRSGVWLRVIKLLPLSRLQHVDLHCGPLERAHGLASLILHTAGTREATHVIPGLDAGEAVRLRDRLVAAGGDDAV